MSQGKLLSAVSNRIKVTFSSLKHKDFRYFWLGQCISLIGTWTQRSAQVWLVYTMTNSPFLLGLLGVAQFLPLLLLSLFAGVFVDRFAKKKIIYLTQIGFMIQSVALAYVVWSGKAEYWHVLLLAAVFGCLQTIDMPARQSWFINMVGKEDLPNAISLNSTVSTLAKILGPAIAGLIAIKFGMVLCFFLNGISYIPVLFSLFFIKAQDFPKPKGSTGVFIEAIEGLRHIAGNITLRTTILSMFVFCTFAMNTSVIIPVFADTVLMRGINGYTTLLSATAVGSFIGAIYMANRSEKVRKKQLILDTINISVLHILSACIGIYPISLAFMVMIGFLSITFLNMANSILQLNTTDAYRGRVMSIYALVNNGSHPLGNVLAGTLMEYHGAAMGFAGCGMITLGLTGLMFLLTPMKEYLQNDDSTSINKPLNSDHTESL
ncbi:MAG TPA: MFS transporter [Bacillota bacterium]|nr:MFS transporter [Bacillota bacterium]HQE66862.1 MFS transporter [Bacillota bacterium]HQJ36935.1 MFS transporter [Bacillota bacterium]HRS20274.1 MFS transporter [Clostridia bacterium]HRU41161.1 MFS transporter [Candidatus Diapherotrites archaeon]